MLLSATRADDGTWGLGREERPTFGNVAQFFAVQDDQVTDLYAMSTDGDLYTLRAGAGKNWKKKLAVGTGPSSMVGAASSKPGLREIAVGADHKIRLFVSTGDGPFEEKESLTLDITPQHVLLATPRSKGVDALYAVAVAGDGTVASSRFRHNDNDWSQVAKGGAGLVLGGQSTAAAISIDIGRLNVMVTNNANRVFPREYA